MFWVYARIEVPRELRRLATAQADVVSHEQVQRSGLSKNVVARLTRSEQWQLVARGIYLCRPGPSTWEANAWAGLLLGGEQSRLGPESSGYLHGLVPRAPNLVDVLIPHHRELTDRGPWRFIRERPGSRSPRSTGSPPRLLVDATVVDLASQRSPAEVLGLVTTAIQSRKTSPERILGTLELRTAHRHRGLIMALLADVRVGAESPLEVHFLRDVERAHALPIGDRQGSRAGLPYCTDVGYDDFALLIELDGRAGHEGMDRFRDMFRDNRFALVALLTLRYGWYDVLERPCAVAWQIAKVFRTRGWTGVLQRCPRCAKATDGDLEAGI